MKNMKWMLALAVAATLAGGSSALADRHVFNLGLGAQYWFAKDADAIDEDGFAGAGLITRVCPAEWLGIEVRAGGVGVWDSDTWRVGGEKYEAEATFYCIPIEAGLVVMLPLGDAVTLYAGPGVGYYSYDLDLKVSEREHHRSKRTYSEEIDLDDDFGWYAVGGLNLFLGPKVSIFAEARYTETETSLKDDDDGDEGKFDASGVGVMCGLMFHF